MSGEEDDGARYARLRRPTPEQRPEEGYIWTDDGRRVKTQDATPVAGEGWR